jgi:ketosteroid isomerase-like protein
LNEVPPSAGVATADAAFSEATAREGIRGFAEFIAADFRTVEPDGSVSPRATLLNDWSKLLSTSGTTIHWHPILSGADGALGWTSGIYESTGSGGDLRSGRYVTIWRRESDGQWKVVFDIGVPNPPPK